MLLLPVLTKFSFEQLMKGLVDFLYEALRPTKGGTIMFDIKNGKVKVDDFIQALSQAHNDLPVKDVQIACDDYEDYDEQTYFEYAGIEGDEMMFKYKSRSGFINKDIYDKLIKDLDEFGKKDIIINWDGMDNDDMQTLIVSADDKADAILIQLGK